MDIKKLLKTYTFWIAVASGLFLLVQFILSLFNIFITKEGYMAVIDGILGIFVMMGFITGSPKSTSKNLSLDENLNTTSQPANVNQQKNCALLGGDLTDISQNEIATEQNTKQNSKNSNLCEQQIPSLSLDAITSVQSFSKNKKTKTNSQNQTKI